MAIARARDWILLAALGLAPALRAQEEGEAPSPKEAGVEEERAPEFKKESTRAEFDKAKGLFGEGKFKEAESLFKKAKLDAKEKEDKAVVEKWLQASVGGQRLEKLKAVVKQKKLRLAYEEGEKQAQAFAATPVAAQFKSFLDELGRQLFTVLESFDNKSPEFSEKYGKTYEADPKLVHDGAFSLHWTSTAERKASALKVKPVPRDWQPFEAVEFWVNITQPPAAEAVIMCAGADRKKGGDKEEGGASSDYFIAPIRFSGASGEWQRVRIPLADFKATGKPSLAQVSHFQIQVPAGKQFDLLIDKVALLAKDPGATPPAKAKGPTSGAERKR